MKTFVKNIIFRSVFLAACFGVTLSQVFAQTFTTLHNFNISTDGAAPLAGLIVSGNTLYGTAYGGGALGSGSVFKLNTDGSGFTDLHPFLTADGASPYAVVALSGSTLYGTTQQGGVGNFSFGTLFKVNTDGSAFTTLRNLQFSDGIWPFAGLLASGGTLYGTAEQGGDSGAGTVFALNLDGSGFREVYAFTGGRDGGRPYASLILSGNTLYGTARYGGGSGYGTVFAVNTDGSSFRNLYSFSAVSTDPAATNSDGAFPDGGLVLSGNALYGTTEKGGTTGFGTVFKVNTDGSGFQSLHSFAALINNPPYGNSDGAHPFAGLIISGSTLYGTTPQGGGAGFGTIFSLNTDGSVFTTLHSFAGGSDGATPYGGLVMSGTTLYGTANAGGTAGGGTIFSLSLGQVQTVTPPMLRMRPSGNNLILMWSTNSVGFKLQSSTTRGQSSIWRDVSITPSIINGQFTVTNAMTGPQQFFRLSQ